MLVERVTTVLVVRMRCAWLHTSSTGVGYALGFDTLEDADRLCNETHAVRGRCHALHQGDILLLVAGTEHTRNTQG